MYEEIKKQAEAVTREICEKANLKKGQILVVGCSSSEVCGDKIGSNSNLEVAQAVFGGIYEVTCEKGIYLAAQCCEHLNRALIVERTTMDQYSLEQVTVMPRPKAGGSFATAVYAAMKDPVAVEFIKADAGLDIGNTLIGMHLKHVAVPLRLSVKHIGEAAVNAARTRPKLIGGVRAEYPEEIR